MSTVRRPWSALSARVSVLDAGCGTGRVAIELARHGVDVVGVDVDASMIGEARRRAPELEWVEADLAATGAWAVNLTSW